MKVTIVTIIDNQNIGTYLQAYALSTVIKQFGHDVKILNYRRKRTKFFPFIKEIWREKKSTPVSALFSILYRVTTVTISRRQLHNFLKKHAVVTRKYYSEKLYQGVEQDADVYIVGSDQVWNSSYNKGLDGVFYLDFVKSNASKKLAYAASIGKDEFSDKEKDAVNTMLKKFKSVSVREAQSIESLHKIGIEDAVHVLDPTLLISLDEWVGFAKQDSFTKTEPYLLVYSVEVANSRLVEKLAKEIALERGLKIYVVTTDWFRGKISCDRIFYFSTPERFLSLFFNADFAVVSSFHGTAFSVNMNKQFLSVAPNKFNSRVYDFLSMCSLEERIVYDDGYSLDGLKTIDYRLVNKSVEAMRANSIKFLSQELKSN